MQNVAAILIRWLIAFLQLLPLRLLAWIGRACGGLAWYLSPRHKQVALDNLTSVFGNSVNVGAVARENLKRIGENYASALKTAAMPLDRLRQVCDVAGLEKFPDFTHAGGARNCVVAIGHFGNFELYTILGRVVPGVFPAATYRGLNQPAFNAIMKSLREKSGCRFFERRAEAQELRNALNKGGVLLGLLADQHAGRGGVWGNFLGRLCSTTSAPAVLALRYDAPLFTAICYRTSLGRWRIEIGDQVRTHENGVARTVAEIMHDVNAALEAAVRRDPANWFWVHKRWKKPKASVVADPEPE